MEARPFLKAAVPVLLLLASCSQERARQSRVMDPLPEPPIEPAPATPPVEPSDAPPPGHGLKAPTEDTMLIGQSVQGRPITMTIFGDRGDTTLIFGGFHGSEPTSVYVAQQLICYLRTRPELYQDRCVVVVPCVNPDGYQKLGRHNANGIDINRNFPARNFPKTPTTRFAGGKTPASEPETLAVMEAMRFAKPSKVISIHSITAGRHGNNFDGPAEDLAREMSRYNNYPVLPTIGYPTPGSFGSWCGVDQQIPTITLELPNNADGHTCWTATRDSLVAAIRFTPAVRAAMK